MNRKPNERQDHAIIAGLLVIFAVGTRIIFNEYHIFNFNAIMAAGFFGGAFLYRNRLALLIPLAAMFATDLVIGLYDWRLMAFVYGGLALTVFLGRSYAKNATLLRLVSSVLAGSFLFFVLTNGAVWLFGDGTFYAHNLHGLIESYTMGLPFYRSSLIGDLTWTTVLFGGFELIRFTSLKPAVA